MSRSNFRDNAPATHRASNFTSRLKQTLDSELEPELVSPQTAGAEELPEYEKVFPLTEQFKQTNMKGRKGKSKPTQRQAGRDMD